MEDFKIIETQEAFDNAIRERLDRQNRKHSEELTALNAENESLKGTIADYEAQKTAEADNATKLSEYAQLIEELKNSKAEADKQIAELTFSAVKRSIADEHGLTAEAREFLTGTTEEELRESAEKLKRLIGTKPATAPLAGVEPTTEESYFIKKYGNNPFYKK